MNKKCSLILVLVKITTIFIHSSCAILFPKNNDQHLFLEDEPSKFEKFYPKDKIVVPPTHLTWGNVVIIMMTFNDPKESSMVQRHFDVWISRMPKELDIVFVTDDDDLRSYEEILPNACNVKPTIHLHKSLQKNEGAKARSKTIDSFSYAYERFKNIDSKQIFLKVDPDTFLITENLLEKIKEVYEKTFPLPLEFGRVDCTRHGNCFTLGASYGMNKIAVEKMFRYLQNNDKLLQNPSFEDKSRLLDEDFFMSYLFQRATGYPIIHVSGMSIRLFARKYHIRGPREEEWKRTKSHITIHLVKSPDDFAMLENFYYDTGRLREKFFIKDTI